MTGMRWIWITKWIAALNVINIALATMASFSITPSSANRLLISTVLTIMLIAPAAALFLTKRYFLTLAEGSYLFLGSIAVSICLGLGPWMLGPRNQIESARAERKAAVRDLVSGVASRCSTAPQVEPSIANADAAIILEGGSTGGKSYTWLPDHILSDSLQNYAVATRVRAFVIYKTGHTIVGQYEKTKRIASSQSAEICMIDHPQGEIVGRFTLYSMPPERVATNVSVDDPTFPRKRLSDLLNSLSKPN